MAQLAQELRSIPMSCSSVTLGKVLLALLAIFLTFAIIGFVIKALVWALVWLGVIGFIFFVVTRVSSVGRRVFERR